MKWRTILWIGVIVFIVFIFLNFVLVIKATTTEQRERREGHENVQLSCPKSLDAAVGDNVTLDFHLKPQWNATKWKGFVFECKQSSNIALVYKSGGFSDVDQAKRFRGRVSSDSSWDLSKGKLEWKISKFGQSDAGTYKCIVRPGKLNCCTELKIKQDHPHELNPSDGYQRHNTSSSIPEKPTDGNSTGSTNTLSGGAIAGIVIAVIVIAVTALAIIAGVIPGGFYGRCPFLLSFPCGRRFEDVRQSDPDAPVAHNGPVQAVDGRAGDQEEPKDQKEGEEGIPLRGIGDQNPPGKKTSEAGTSLVFGQSLASL